MAGVSEQVVASHHVPLPIQARVLMAVEQHIDRLDSVKAYLARVRASDSSLYSRAEISRLSSSNPVAFASKYLLKNAVKCAFVSELYRDLIAKNSRIVDLGTGPGTFLFNFALSSSRLDLLGLDQSRRALKLAKMLFSVVRCPPPLLIQAELPEAIVAGSALFTASYFVEELGRGGRDDFAAFILQEPLSQFLVVDYPDVIRELQAGVGKRRVVGSGEYQLNLPRSLADKVGDDQISFGVLYAPRARITGQPAQKKLAGSQHLGADRLIYR